LNILPTISPYHPQQYTPLFDDVYRWEPKLREEKTGGKRRPGTRARTHSRMKRGLLKRRREAQMAGRVVETSAGGRWKKTWLERWRSKTRTRRKGGITIERREMTGKATEEIRVDLRVSLVQKGGEKAKGRN
jgi:hypothetical protein